MGGVLLPLSVLFPGFGLLVAAVGIAAQGTMTWQVWANPRSTWGQKGLSAILLVGSVWLGTKRTGITQKMGV